VTLTERLSRILETAVADVDAQLYHDLKTRVEKRPELLAQIDVLTKVRDRLAARIAESDHS